MNEKEYIKALKNQIELRDVLIKELQEIIVKYEQIFKDFKEEFESTI